MLRITVSSASQLKLFPEIHHATFAWDGPRGYDFAPEILKLARQKPGLKFDIGSVTQTGGIEALAKSVQRERLVLEYPDLPARYLAHAARAGFAEPSQYRRMITHRKIDTHWHTSQWGIGFEPRSIAEYLLADMTRFRLDYAIFSDIRALEGDLSGGNAICAKLCSRDNRVRGLVVINPTMITRSLAEIEKYQHLAVGIKTIQDEFEGGLLHPGYREILNSVPSHWPFMAHLGGLRELARALPDRIFIAAHSTWDWRSLVGLPNIYFDIATSARHDLTDLVKTCPHRVLFSSDAPLISPVFTLGKLAALELDDATLDAILYRNAAKLFNLPL